MFALSYLIEINTVLITFSFLSLSINITGSHGLMASLLLFHHLRAL